MKNRLENIQRICTRQLSQCIFINERTCYTGTRCTVKIHDNYDRMKNNSNYFRFYLIVGCWHQRQGKKIRCDSWLRTIVLLPQSTDIFVENRDKFFFIVGPVISIATGELYSMFVRTNAVVLPSSQWIDKTLLHTNNNCSASDFIRSFRMQNAELQI